MFAFFNLGLMEILVLTVLGVVPLGLLVAFLLGAFATKQRDED